MENVQIIGRCSSVSRNAYNKGDKIFFEIFTVKVAKEIMSEWEEIENSSYSIDTTEEEKKEYFEKWENANKKFNRKLMELIYIDEKDYTKVIVKPAINNLFSITTILRLK